MMISWMLAVLLSSDPTPVFGFLKEYRTQEDCQRQAKSMQKNDADMADKLACIPIGHEAI